MNLKEKIIPRVRNLMENPRDYASAMIFAVLGIFIISSGPGSFLMWILGIVFMGKGALDYVNTYEKIKKRKKKKK